MKGDSVPFIQKQEGEPVMKIVNGMPYAKHAFMGPYIMGYIPIVNLAVGINGWSLKVKLVETTHKKYLMLLEQDDECTTRIAMTRPIMCQVLLLRLLTEISIQPFNHLLMLKLVIFYSLIYFFSYFFPQSINILKLYM